MGGSGQEHRDQASRPPGPKKRPERLSQLSLAQFLFLLAPASLPGCPSFSRGAAPVVLLPLLHSPQGAPPRQSSPPPLLPLPLLPSLQGAPLRPCPPTPPPQRTLPGSAHCGNSSENTSGVKVRRTVTTPAGMGFPRTMPSCFLRPEWLLPGSPAPLPGAPSPLRRECPCTASVPCSVSWDTPPPTSGLLQQRHAPGHREPPPHSAHYPEATSLPRGNFPLRVWPWPRLSCGRSPRAGWVGPVHRAGDWDGKW